MTDPENNLQNLCRLCGSDGGIRINIFEPAPGFIGKIEALVPNVVILRWDCFPKSLCHRCVAKLKEYHEFRENCIKTQERFRQLVPWMSATDISSSKPVKEVPAGSPMVLFMGGSPAHPFGDPEPEVEVLTLSDDDDDISKKPSPCALPRTADVGVLGPAKRRRSDTLAPKHSVQPPVSKKSDQYHISSGPAPSLQRVYRPNTSSPEGSSTNSVPKPAVTPVGVQLQNVTPSQLQTQSFPPSLANHSDSSHTTSRAPLPHPTSQLVQQKTVASQPQRLAQGQHVTWKGPPAAVPLSNITPGTQMRTQLPEQTKHSLPGAQSSIPSWPVSSVRPAFYTSVRITDTNKAKTDKSPIKLKISAVHSAIDAAGQWTGSNGCSLGNDAITAQTSDGPKTQTQPHVRPKPKPKSKQKLKSTSARSIPQEQEHSSRESIPQCQPPPLNHLQMQREEPLLQGLLLQSQVQRQTEDKPLLNSKIQSIPISKTKSVFTCNECNTIFTSAESAVGHNCLGRKSPSTSISVTSAKTLVLTNGVDAVSQITSKDQITKRTNNSNGLSCIPCIPIVDDDSPSLPENELFTCRKCSKVFHSCTRLERHQTSCQGAT